MEEIKESELSGYSKTISFKCAETILEQMQQCVCKIKIKDKQGTGFFCKIPFPTKLKMLPVFVTNNHIIDEDLLNKKNEEILISIKGEHDIKRIELKNKKFYTNEEYDTAIIEIGEDFIKNYLELDDIILDDILEGENNNKEFIDETIYTIQYPEGKLAVSYGILKNIYEDEKYNFNHVCSTRNGSSGSPILNIDNNKIIGIHKQSHGNKFNSGTFLNFPIKEFIKKYFYKVKNNINNINDNNINNIEIEEQFNNNINKHDNNPKIENKNLNNIKVNKIGSNEQDKNIKKEIIKNKDIVESKIIKIKSNKAQIKNDKKEKINNNKDNIIMNKVKENSKKENFIFEMMKNEEITDFISQMNDLKIEKINLSSKDAKNPNLTFNISILGYKDTGKTFLVLRELKNEFTLSPTFSKIGVDLKILCFNINDDLIHLKTYAFPGVERYRSILLCNRTKFSLFILAYSVKDRKSFEELDTFLRIIKEKGNPDARIFLVGNKADDDENGYDDKREVLEEEGNEYKEENGLDFFIETSAKTGYNVKELFIGIAKILYLDHLTKGKYKEIPKNIKAKKEDCMIF